MSKRFFNIKMSDLVYDDEFHNGRRFTTDWTGSDGSVWRVSSVDNPRTTETMIFKVEEDGEVNYFDLDCVKEFVGTREMQGRFLQEYLQRVLDRAHAEYVAPYVNEEPQMVLMDRFTDLYGGVAIDEMDEDEGRPH